MLTRPRASRHGVVVIALVLSGCAVSTAEKPKQKPVREITERVAGTDSRRGVVAHIDEHGMTVVEIPGEGEPREFNVVPVDRLRKGEIIDNVGGREAYRWTDVKKGDTVDVVFMKDKIEGKLYCLEICIERRPGAKLPKSQLPKEDHRYIHDRIYNDLENGSDVSDADILEAFPGQPVVKDRDGTVVRPGYPAGLPRDWQAKLDAIRAKKKEGDLKASPPEKK